MSEQKKNPFNTRLQNFLIKAETENRIATAFPDQWK